MSAAAPAQLPILAVRNLTTSFRVDGEWTTVGVSQDIVTASWEALADGVVFGLLRAGAPALAGMALAAIGVALVNRG